MKRSFDIILKELRESKKMNQQELADALGITRQSVSNYETGKRMPNKEMLEIIADYFNVDMNFLYGKTLVKNKYRDLKNIKEPEDETSEKVKVLAREAGDLSDVQIDLLRSMIKQFKEGKR